MLSEPITDPKGLSVPPDIKAVLEGVTPQGARDFLDELVDALDRGSASGDLRPVQDVVNAWYKTLLFAQAMDPEAADGVDRDVESILAGDRGPGLSFDELREKLSLPDPS